MKWVKQKLKNESGQGLVEFALILPLLLLLILGMFEFGWLLNAKMSVHSTANTITRTVVVAQGDRAEKVKNAKSIADRELNAGYTMTIPTFPESGKPITVTISNKVKPLIGLYVSGTQEIVGEATMRME